jgi:hypothetical protein
MKGNAINRRHKRTENGALLSGLFHDDHGNRMTPTFTVKRGVRYRFYISAALLKGHKENAGSLPRISGPDLEAAVLAALRDKKELALPQGTSDDRKFISELIERVEVSRGNIRLALKTVKGISESTGGAISRADEPYSPNSNRHIDIKWQRNLQGPLACVEENQVRGNEPESTLVQAVARAHTWVKLLTDGTHTSIESLAASIDMHPKVVRKSIRLAFLSPDITKDILLETARGNATLAKGLQVAGSLCWRQQSVKQVAILNSSRGPAFGGPFSFKK